MNKKTQITKAKQPVPEKLGINRPDDTLNIPGKNNHVKRMPKKRSVKTARIKNIKGRAYFYSVENYTDQNGKRRQHSRYLGKTLPRGYHLPTKHKQSQQ